MSQDHHKIDADDRDVFNVLHKAKYTIDYFQREYSWERKHIEQLVTDLTSAFLQDYTEGDPRSAGKDYSNYYLGPFVVISKDGAKSIVDGQQRLTSLTLLFIFLNHLQTELGLSETIEPLVFSELRGEKTFNIQVEERRHCLDQLFREGFYDIQPDDDESTVNMAERYGDIVESFPDEIKGEAFPHFVDWLKYNVVLVEIVAYSDDNAYAIFESMNDRGLNLTSTEMLKSYILSRFRDLRVREQTNRFWRQSVQRLHDFSKEEDQQFFQAWLRSQYADTIRSSKRGSSNQDFEKIGTRFHSWFRDNIAKLNLTPEHEEGFRELVHREMKFFHRAYLDILEAQKQEKAGWEHVFYIYHRGIAPSLAFPLMLAPLRSTDEKDIVRQKIDAVARYIETFVVRRSVNFRTYSASSIRYTMYSLVKELRGKSLQDLRQVLQIKKSEMEDTWGGMATFRLHGKNRKFVKFLLSRITAFVEQQSGSSTTFTHYYLNPARGTKRLQIEHIWADKFGSHRSEFDQKHEFDNYRNRIGDLLLLPQGTRNL